MFKSTELLFLFLLLAVADEKEKGSTSGKWAVPYDGKDLVAPTNNTVEMKNSSDGDVYCYTLNKTDLALNKELKACESSVCTTWFNNGTLTSTCYEEEKFDFNCSQVQESCSNDDELDCCCNKSLCNSRNSTVRPTANTTRAAESNATMTTTSSTSATTAEPEVDETAAASTTTSEQTTREPGILGILPSVPLSLLILAAVVELGLNVVLMKMLNHYWRRWRRERVLRKGCLFNREKMKKRIGQKEEVLKEMESKTIGAKKVVEYYSKKLYDVKQLGRKRRAKRKAARDAAVSRYDEWERRLEKLVKRKGRKWPLSTPSSFSSSPSSSPTSSYSESGTSESGQSSESARREELHEQIMAAARTMEYGNIFAGGRNGADEQTKQAEAEPDDGLYE